MPITQFALHRTVQGTSTTLTAEFVDQDGEPRTPGPVTVGIVRSDGSVLLAPLTATTTDVNGNPTVALTPSQSSILDVLMCTWTETATGATVTTVVELIGGRYFTLRYARTVDDVLKDTGKFPDEDLKRVRTEVELELEGITGRSFVPRYRTDQSEAVDVRVGRSLQLAEVDVRSVRWVKVAGTAYTNAFWRLTSSGRLAFGSEIGLTPYQVANGPQRLDLPVLITVGYEFGWPSVPDDLKRQMVVRMRSKLIEPNSSVPDRATAMTVDGSTFSLSTPGLRGAKTGIPSVDECYRGYTRKDWSEAFVGSIRVI